MKDNIILIGMPGCGKSTVGVVYAKTLGYDFLDLDLVISRRADDTLQNIIDRRGVDAFLALEENAACTVQPEQTVIATGGSVVLSECGMAHLKSIGKTVFLDVSPDALEKRIRNFSTRGIACKAGQTLRDIYNDRIALYRKYADFTVNCDSKEIPDVVEALHKIHTR